MTSDGPFPEDPTETRVEILKATDAALRRHGYADLTIDRISREFPKSKSLLYHHYDSKDELLLDFLGYLLTSFEDGLGLDPDASPHERLTTLLNRVLDPASDRDDDAFRRAITELRVQGASDEAYRQQFTEHDRLLRDRMADIVAEGVEAGVYREVDPDQVAAMLHTLANGSMVQTATSDADARAAVRAELDAYFEHRLLADGR